MPFGNLANPLLNTVLCNRKDYDCKDVLEDASKHENANHKCTYFGSECPYKGIKFMEKVEL